MDEEIWKPVFNYEGLYSVSNFGRIRREKAAPHTRIGYILKPSVYRKTGYLSIGLNKLNFKKSRFKVHLLVARAFLGPCPTGFQCNHIDGIKSNNCLSNLEYVSAFDNIEHGKKLSLFRKGSINSQAKLTEKQALEIRVKHASGNFKPSDLSSLYKVSPACIYFIIQRKSWKHV